MRVHEFITEITKMDQWEYQGGKPALKQTIPPKQKQVYKLPGTSGYLYSIPRSVFGGYTIVQIWDPTGKKTDESYPGALIGKLTLQQAENFPIKNALSVHTITVDEDYRGMGIAKALYGIVLTILKKPMVAGDSQTPGGRRNWLSLSNIPGVEVKGYVMLYPSDLTADKIKKNLTYMSNKQRKIANVKRAKKIDRNIDTIMGKLGGQYIGKLYDNNFFAFDVMPGNGELRPVVKDTLTKLYAEEWDWDAEHTGLYAVWTGATE